MNILHVVNISFVIPYFLGKQLLFFKERGYNEHIICSPSNDLENLSNELGFYFKEVEVVRKISLWKDLMAVFKVMKYIKLNSIDIVIGHTPKGALIAMLASFLMRVPVRIYFRHGLVYETSAGFKRKLLMKIDKIAARLSTQIICVSPSICKRSLEDKLNPIKKQCLLFKGTCNGIDIERFNRKSLELNRIMRIRNCLNIDSANFVIGFTGRLVKDKGIIELVYAFKKLSGIYNNISLLLVGMLEERDALPDEVVNLIKETPAIIHTGYVPNASIEYYYALMDVFVLPSYREGFPTSVLEASAMQLPIITTKATGCIDSIVSGQTGVFVEHDSKCIAMAIEKFYLDRNLQYSYGQNGRNFVVDNFEQSMIWHAIEAIYNKTFNR